MSTVPCEVVALENNSDTLFCRTTVVACLRSYVNKNGPLGTGAYDDRLVHTCRRNEEGKVAEKHEYSKGRMLRRREIVYTPFSIDMGRNEKRTLPEQRSEAMN